ncbi:MAG: ISAs1 family transposase [Bacteroidota bacterium]|nr:ISAs1 family transposase [Bacteroidota bacterium]
MEWQQYFEAVPDFRLDRKKLHLLGDILMLSLCAILSGAEDFEDMENYGKQKESFLRQFLALPNGIPSHDTINRVYNRLDKDKFAACLYRWSEELLDFLEYYQVAIDGKVLRGTAKSGEKKSGICLVSAWAQEQRLVLGQRRVESKSNEKTAIPELIASLDLPGAIVSIDAVACTEKIADQITAKGAHYLLALKKNQKQLFEQVSDQMLRQKAALPKAEWVDFGSGRIEKRVCYVSEQLDLLDDLASWPAISRVVMVEASREKEGKREEQTRFYLSSLLAPAAVFNQLIRNHWSIENQLHWLLDVVFQEDQSRTRKGNVPENMATLRKMALQILNQNMDKHSIKSRRKIAAWNDDYLLNLLKNLTF